MGQRPVKLPRLVHAFIDRHGRSRFYLRRKGYSKVPLPGLPWSPSFMEVYERALFAHQQVEIGASRTTAGTLNAAVVAYYKSGAFTKELGESTQSSQRSLVERFRAEHGDKRLRKLERRHMQTYISSLQSQSVQPNMLRAMRHFPRFAGGRPDRCRPERWRQARQDGKCRRVHTWSEEHVARFEATHPVGSRARLALALYLNFGVRKSDVVRVGPRHVKDGVLADFLPLKTTRTGGTADQRAADRGDEGADCGNAGHRRRHLSGDRVRQAVHRQRLRKQDADWCDRRFAGMHQPRTAQIVTGAARRCRGH